jgi:hypothetical protein
MLSGFVALQGQVECRPVQGVVLPVLRGWPGLREERPQLGGNNRRNDHPMHRQRLTGGLARCCQAPSRP